MCISSLAGIKLAKYMYVHVKSCQQSWAFASPWLSESVTSWSKPSNHIPQLFQCITISSRFLIGSPHRPYSLPISRVYIFHMYTIVELTVQLTVYLWSIKSQGRTEPFISQRFNVASSLDMSLHGTNDELWSSCSEFHVNRALELPQLLKTELLSST